MLRYLVFLTFLTGAARAQDSAAHLLIGVTGNSGLNYYGRVDSLRSSAISPFIGVSLKNGLYINANFVFIHNRLESRYAATLVEGGYKFVNKKGTWAGNMSTTKFFYQDNIDLIQSAVKQFVTASITCLNKIANVTLGADVKFSDQADPGLQGGLDHIIRFGKVFQKGVIVIDPSAYLYAGTQRFTQTFYQQKNILIFPSGEEAFTKEGKQFSLLAYEVSLPVVFAYGKLQFILSPAYVMPQHAFTPTGNLFYVTSTVKVKI